MPGLGALGGRGEKSTCGAACACAAQTHLLLPRPPPGRRRRRRGRCARGPTRGGVAAQRAHIGLPQIAQHTRHQSGGGQDVAADAVQAFERVGRSNVLGVRTWSSRAWAARRRKRSWHQALPAAPVLASRQRVCVHTLRYTSDVRNNRTMHFLDGSYCPLPREVRCTAMYCAASAPAAAWPPTRPPAAPAAELGCEVAESTSSPAGGQGWGTEGGACHGGRGVFVPRTSFSCSMQAGRQVQQSRRVLETPPPSMCIFECAHDGACVRACVRRPAAAGAQQRAFRGAEAGAPKMQIDQEEPPRPVQQPRTATPASLPGPRPPLPPTPIIPGGSPGLACVQASKQAWDCPRG